MFAKFIWKIVLKVWKERHYILFSILGIALMVMYIASQTMQVFPTASGVVALLAFAAWVFIGIFYACYGVGYLVWRGVSYVIQDIRS
ncbi:MAG: hypothetical protein P4L53_03645 [Candidatus Obscuribacterales bacterium]|nr:hypothetical protein [Candidatus Obscuribacterales bacterium]